MNTMPLSLPQTDHTQSLDGFPSTGDATSPPPELHSRLVLSPRPGAATDGTWWPRTLDLRLEAPLLDVAVHELTRTRIARLGYERSMWDAAPRKIRTPLGITHLGWFDHSRFPHHVLLTMSNYVRLVLAVIPPDMDADAARGMLHATGAVDAEMNRAEAREAGNRWADDGGARQAAHHRK